MTGTQPAPPTAGTGLRPAFAATRAQLGLVAVLFLLAGVGWWWTAGQMRGMDNGPWTGLGTFGWFLGVWVVMMAAMMFPSVAPTVALYSRMSRQSRLVPAVFTAGYLVTWAAAGVIAFAVGAVATRVAGGDLAWDEGGRVPLKNACLGRCRSPLGALLGSWRDGWSGALRMGAKNGAWCVGCCWALMASLFALGVMSVTWMALVAGLIAMEKVLPWRRPATYGTALVLCVLGLLVLVAPDVVPSLTVPGQGQMPAMTPMGS